MTNSTQNTDQDSKKLRKQLATAIRQHFELQVTNPAVSLLDIDFQAQDDLASLLIMNKSMKDLIIQKDLGEIDQFLNSFVNKNLICDSHSSAKNMKNSKIFANYNEVTQKPTLS